MRRRRKFTSYVRRVIRSDIAESMPLPGAPRFRKSSAVSTTEPCSLHPAKGLRERSYLNRAQEIVDQFQLRTASDRAQMQNLFAHALQNGCHCRQCFLVGADEESQLAGLGLGTAPGHGGFCHAQASMRDCLVQLSDPSRT